MYIHLIDSVKDELIHNILHIIFIFLKIRKYYYCFYFFYFTILIIDYKKIYISPQREGKKNLIIYTKKLL